jgi:hypothetical protein
MQIHENRVRTHDRKFLELNCLYRWQALGDDVAASLRELMVEVTRVINLPGACIGCEKTSRIPKEVKDRIRHFAKEPKSMMTTAWVVDGDETEFSMTIEKWGATSPYDCQDEVWRVAGDDWEVTLLGTTRYWDDLVTDPIYLVVPYEMLGANADGIFPGYVRPTRKLDKGSLFHVKGEDHLLAQATMWKLCR